MEHHGAFDAIGHPNRIRLWGATAIAAAGTLGAVLVVRRRAADTVGASRLWRGMG
jgi:hypothetical protein